MSYRPHFSLWMLTIALPSMASTQTPPPHCFRSDSLPRLQVHVASEFTYLGEISFPVDSVAVAKQVVYGVAKGGQLVRAVILHFEHFLPGQARTFTYPRLRMTQLGSNEYLHQTWAFGDLSLFRQPELVALLARHNLTAGPRWVMDRYVRSLAENPQYEVIFFYLESDLVSDPSIVYGGRPVAPPPPPTPPATVEADIIQRARAAFWITP